MIFDEDMKDLKNNIVILNTSHIKGGLNVKINDIARGGGIGRWCKMLRDLLLVCNSLNASPAHAGRYKNLLFNTMQSKLKKIN